MGRHLAAAMVVAGLGASLWPPPAYPQEPSSADKADRLSAWTGLSYGPDYLYAYAGTTIAVTGDMEMGGLMARVGVGGGTYRTESDTAHNVVQYDTNLLLGYRLNSGDGVMALYAGADFNRHENSDPQSNPNGSEVGVKGLVEAYAPLGSAFYVTGHGSYSTAFENSSTDVKLAYRLSEVLTVGPQAGAVGSAGFAQARAGLASAWRLGDDTEFAGTAGAGWDLDDADFGFYGSVNLYTEF